MTTIYLATSGTYDDYRVQAVFTRREDAEAFGLGDDVEEFELHDGPLETRAWHQVRWYADRPERPGTTNDGGNPYHSDRELRIWDGNPDRVEVTRFDVFPQILVEGWDLALVRSRLDEPEGTNPPGPSAPGLTESEGCSRRPARTPQRPRGWAPSAHVHSPSVA